jgi:flagellar biosynthesis protein FlhG
MSDQAEKLRDIVGALGAVAPFSDLPQANSVTTAVTQNCISSPTTRWLIFSSGKGGVGTSNIVLNLAVALGEMGQRVVVVDADIGLANIDLLCGLAPQYDVGDVLAGRCGLLDTLVTGPGDIQIIPGVHALRIGAEELGEGPARLAAELSELETEADFVLVDAGSGLGPGIAALAADADQAVVVSTPEPTSIVDAHAAIRRFRRLAVPPPLRVIINQVGSDAEAIDILDLLVRSSQQFVGAVVSPMGTGWIRADPRVPVAVRARRPFVSAFPKAAASRDVRRLARGLLRQGYPSPRKRRGFFAAFASRLALSRTAGG